MVGLHLKKQQTLEGNKIGQWGVASDEPLDGGVRDIIKHVVAILRSAERNQVGLMLRSHS